MGRKSDELREELGIVEAERDKYMQLTTELQLEVDRLTNARGRAVAITTTAGDEDREPAVAVDRIADAERAIGELRNPPAPINPVESLTEIVRANNHERSELNTRFSRANTALNRIASALGVTHWDHDASEVLERAQRFATFSHWLGRRLKECEDGMRTDTTSTPVNIHLAQADAFRGILTALVAPEALSKFVRERKPPTSTPAMFAAATIPDVATGTFLDKLVTREDLIWLRDAAAVYAAERQQIAPEWLALVVKSEVATADLLDLLNLVMMPMLRRVQGVVRTPSVA